jgi:hypothetical protein
LSALDVVVCVRKTANESTGLLGDNVTHKIRWAATIPVRSRSDFAHGNPTAETFSKPPLILADRR